MRIRQARKAARLTQEHLAEKAALNRVTVAVLEADRQVPSAETLWRIAQATGQSLDWFFAKEAQVAEGVVRDGSPARPEIDEAWPRPSGTMRDLLAQVLSMQAHIQGEMERLTRVQEELLKGQDRLLRAVSALTSLK